MKETVYIFSNGEIERKDNTILFESEDGIKKYLPVENIREICIFGEIDLNKRVLEFFTKKEIILHFFNYYSYYVGSYYPREHYNSGYMILHQVRGYENAEMRLNIARNFVEGAAKNCLKIMKYYDRREKDLSGQIDAVENALGELGSQTSIETLMSVEGKIKQFYYQCFATIIDNPEFSFERRSKRPPKDYINSLISFANSIIYTACLSEIYQTHLDPRIGFLHTSNFRRFSLNLDIAEIFKPVVGDRTIFSVLNKNVITEEDFDKDLNGIILKPSGKRKFAEALETRMKQTIKHSTLKNDVSYRRLIRLECYKIEKYLMGECEYKPFVMDW
jgi:CRISPR-associated protein Cas1